MDVLMPFIPLLVLFLLVLGAVMLGNSLSAKLREKKQRKEGGNSR